MRILVPSAGAASSVSVIKAARHRSDFVLATDLNKRAVGMMLANHSVVSGMCYEEPYIDSIIEMCHEHGVGYVIPINDAELPVYNMHRDILETAGINVLINPHDCVLNGVNKERSWAVCDRAGLRQPLRYLQNVDPCSTWQRSMPPRGAFPIIAKPSMGVGGRGQHVCHSPYHLRKLVQGMSKDAWKCHEFIWQEYIDGTEYSVDCWGDPNTNQFVAVPRTRGRIINGQATTGMTCADADVIDFTRQICKAFGSNNVCCVQVMRRKTDGVLYFIEFNPRYGTGVSLSFAAGVDFLQLQQLQTVEREPTPQMLTFCAGVGMARYWEEKFYVGKDTHKCPPKQIMQTSGLKKV